MSLLQIKRKRVLGKGHRLTAMCARFSDSDRNGQQIEHFPGSSAQLWKVMGLPTSKP